MEFGEINLTLSLTVTPKLAAKPCPSAITFLPWKLSKLPKLTFLKISFFNFKSFKSIPLIIAPLLLFCLVPRLDH